MATNDYPRFSSEIPYSLFHRDFQQSSIHDLEVENRTFLWHQFMLDVLIHIPHSSADIENIIGACQLANKHDTINEFKTLDDHKIEELRINYRTKTIIDLYKDDSILYRAINTACRMLDSDALVLFHPVVKDLEAELKQVGSEQLANGTLELPLTVFRGQKMSLGELKKIEENIGGLISMHTFLSTTRTCHIASGFLSDFDPATAVIFQITIDKTKQDKFMPTFADISKMGTKEHEKEVLIGMSTVFRIVSVEQDDCNWFIELESTNCKEDSSMQKFINEVRTYVHQNSGKQLPLKAFKQLFTIDSLGYPRPFIELMRFFLIETIQLFMVQMYKKEGRMKTLIDSAPDLHELITTTNADTAVAPNNKIICLFIDVLQQLFYPSDDNNQSETCFDNDANISLLTFGGYLLLTGDLQKGTQYLQMLLNNEEIDNTLKFFIHGLLAASYGISKEKELASKSIEILTDISQSSTTQSMPGWFPSFVASSYTTMDYVDPRIDDAVLMLEPLTNEEQSSSMVDEKIRLLHVGHVLFQQAKFVDALNHWEEAIEIKSHIPSSVEMMLDGAIYVQIAAAYFRLNNQSDALHIMEKGNNYIGTYYPSTHRMFGNLNFIYGYYLMHNNNPSEAIKYFNKSLENSHFSTNHEFCGVIITLLAVASMQSGDIDSAEVYCRQALAYPPTGIIGAQIPEMLKAIPQLKALSQFMGRDLLQQLVGAGLQLGQLLASQNQPHSSTTPESTNEEIWTSEKFIAVADYYRHRRDNQNAELYYRKALDKLTETESKLMWNVYRKMIRLSNDNDQYRYDFIEQFSKYDDNNPNHYSMVFTLQIILYKFSLAQNEYEMAFDCLMSSVLIAVKSFFSQANIDLFGLVLRFLHHEPIMEITDMLIKIMEIYSAECAKHLQQFLSKYEIINEVAAIIQHTTIDRILDQMKLKYDNKPSAKIILQFLGILLEFLRQNVPSTEPSTLSFTDQILQFLGKYKDEKSPWFYFVRALESLCIGDNNNFSINIEQFRSQTMTFKRYQEWKEKLSTIFERLDENDLYSCVQNFTKTL